MKYFQIIKQELLHHSRNISTWLFVGLLYLSGFLLIFITGGGIPNANINLFKSPELIKANSPASLSVAFVLIYYLFFLIVPSLFSSSAIKEYEENSVSLILSKPLSAFLFYFGKFCATFIITLFIFFSFLVGIISGSYMPFIDPAKISTYYLSSCLNLSLTFIIPNILISGLMIFSFTVLSRKMLNGFILSLIFYLFNIISIVLKPLSNDIHLSVLLDPFGINCLSKTIQGWSFMQLNTAPIPLSKWILMNRIFWFAGALIFLTFILLLTKRNPAFFNKADLTKDHEENRIQAKSIDLKIENYVYDFTITMFFYLIWYEIKSILKNNVFLFLLMAYIIITGISATQIGHMMGTKTYPLTFSVLDTLTAEILFFSIILSTIYSGELIWKERISQYASIFDSCPYRSHVIYLSKIIPVLIMQALFLLILMIIGLVTQITQHFFHFNLSLYIVDLFVLKYSTIIIYTLLAFGIQVVLNNRYVGFFTVIIVYVVNMLLMNLGINHPLVIFNYIPPIIYSDLNGFGPFIMPYLIIKSYWLFVMILFFQLSATVWPRGENQSLLKKVNSFSFSSFISLPIVINFLLIIGIARYIYYNCHILNEFPYKSKQEQMAISYEKQFSHFKDILQPKIRVVNVQSDIFSSQRRAIFSGYYILENDRKSPINNIIVNIMPIMSNPKVELNIPIRSISHNKDYGFYILELKNPLMPRDSVRMDFSYQIQLKGFSHPSQNIEFLKNSSFFSNYYFPKLGFNEDYILKKQKIRRKYNLPDLKDGLNKDGSDILAGSTNADWISFEAKISVDKGQYALAPGTLMRRYLSHNRSVFHYKMQTPMRNHYIIVTGKYSIRKVIDNNRLIEIYYHPNHSFNINTIIQSAQASLAYCIKNYGPYHSNVLRIVEIPRYANIAVSFPTLIPISEGMGFIAKVNPDKNIDVDYPFFVTAHEVAHQWWANQLAPAKQKGAVFLTEPIAQYVAFKCLRNKYKEELSKKILYNSLQEYINGRRFSTHKEPPLCYSEQQTHLYYHKGLLMFNRLDKLIGEEKLNTILREFYKKYRYCAPPYPVSDDLVQLFYQNNNSSDRVLISELLEKVVLYDFELKNVFSQKKESLYWINFDVLSKKMVGDIKNAEEYPELREVLSVTFYKNNRMIKEETIDIKQKIQRFSFILREKPDKIVIDSEILFLDINRDNNEYLFQDILSK